MTDEPVNQMIAPDVRAYLTQLRIYRFQVVYQFQESAHLPPFKGSMFRGALGAALIRTSCSCIKKSKGSQDFDVTAHEQYCSFGYLFQNEPNLVAQAEHWTTNLANMQKPRPMMINASSQIQRQYEIGDRISIELTLFGDAIEHMPLLVLALKELGEIGVGSHRAKLKLIQVGRLDELGNWAAVVYDGRDDTIRVEHLLPLPLDDILSHPVTTETLMIRYMTPTRLKSEGLLSDKISFAMLFQSAYRRIVSLLAYYHSDSQLPDVALYDQLMKEAKQIEPVTELTQWIELERYSNRQKQKMNLGGVVGMSTFRGDWQRLIAILLLSQWTGIGKSTVFGLGQIKVFFDN